MLAAVRLTAVALGVGAGTLASTALTMLLWGLLAALGVDQPAVAGLSFAVLGGFLVGGYVAGRLAIVVHRFHGSLTGLVLAGVVVLISKLGGSLTPTGEVLLLAVFGIVLGGLGGFLGGRRQAQARARP